MPSVCVFCASSRSIDERYPALARDVGAAIAGRGWTLVSGGGSISMMGAVATAARGAGGRTVGVIPDALVAMEVADHGADELVITRDMRQRKGIMDERSDAFLALPGGLGTLEELTEAWTARSLNLHHKPVVVLDPWADYRHLHAQLDHWVTLGFVSPASLLHVRWTTGIDEALDEIADAWSAAAPPPRGGMSP